MPRFVGHAAPRGSERRRARRSPRGRAAPVSQEPAVGAGAGAGARGGDGAQSRFEVGIDQRPRRVRSRGDSRVSTPQRQGRVRSRGSLIESF